MQLSFESDMVMGGGGLDKQGMELGRNSESPGM